MSQKRKADSPPLTSVKQSKTTIDAFHEALTLLEDTAVVPSTSAVTDDPLKISLDTGDSSQNVVEHDDEDAMALEDAIRREMEDESLLKATEPSDANELTATDELDLMTNAASEEDELTRIRMRLLMANFSSEQLDRYEAMRRASFPKSVVKRLISRFGNTVVNNSVVIAMAGLAKVFTGELVEEALNIQEKAGEGGSLTPRHLMLAYAKLERDGKLFPVRPRRNPLTRSDVML